MFTHLITFLMSASIIGRKDGSLVLSQLSVTYCCSGLQTLNRLDCLLGRKLVLWPAAASDLQSIMRLFFMLTECNVVNLFHLCRFRSSRSDIAAGATFPSFR
ncbi:hypothetical protein M378DRAFT_918864 [Amanita muscaria Koide BX008]|uniref:Uncharacterized protein n=1 Tax=Amanita muscaria (strain Koide BX008) TaxID=946122 RepID=A0A0C2T224_AMAMK|nr:hypothetical protein M378DRAFT_918864 [Amanita muscaria Koide BX008]